MVGSSFDERLSDLESIFQREISSIRGFNRFLMFVTGGKKTKRIKIPADVCNVPTKPFLNGAVPSWC